MKRFLYVFAFISLFICFGSIPSALAYQWFQYGGHSYTSTSDWETWEQAEAVNHGGHLVKINDDTENVWLTNTFKDTYTRSNAGDPSHNIAWIGYYNNGTDWKWISGEPVTYYRDDYPLFPEGGTYTYLHLAYHPYAGTWNANPPHETEYDCNPKGIIEVSSAVPLPSAIFLLGPGLIGIFGFRKFIVFS